MKCLICASLRTRVVSAVFGIVTPIASPANAPLDRNKADKKAFGGCAVRCMSLFARASSLVRLCWLRLQQPLFPQEGGEKLVENLRLLQPQEMPSIIHDVMIYLGGKRMHLLLVPA